MRHPIVFMKVLSISALIILCSINILHINRNIDNSNPVKKTFWDNHFESKESSVAHRHLPVKYGRETEDDASHRTLYVQPIFLGNEALEFKSGSPSEDKTRVIVKLNNASPNARSDVVQKLKYNAGGENVHGFASVMRDFVVMDINQSSGQVLEEEEGILEYFIDKELKADDVQCSNIPPQLWNKDRIDQPFLPLDHTFGLPNKGSGVTVYILDDGVYPHDDLEGIDKTRPSRVTDYFDCYQKPCQLQPNSLSHEELCTEAGTGYHGTFVAGVCCGTITGIAPKSTIVSLRMMDCNGNGYASDFINALDEAVVHCLESSNNNRCVINASLNGPYNPLLDYAIAEAVDAGLVFVGSAGNENADSCHSSPARAIKGITVGASEINNDSTDTKALFSNWGNCVDIMAPGSSIVGPYYLNSKQGLYGAASGTSFAAPAVSGAVALYLSNNPTTRAHAVKEAIVSQSHHIKVDGIYPLLYIPGGCGASPTASPTSSPITQPAIFNNEQTDALTNLAKGRSTMQGISVKDKSSGTFNGDPSVSLSYSWWRVDLYSPNNIVYEVRINHLHEGNAATHDLEVSVLDWDCHVVESFTHHSVSGTFVSIPFEGVRGRYVKIQLNTFGEPLVLTEVAVMGHLEDPLIPVPVNMALQKPTTGTKGYTPTSVAVDGDTSGDYVKSFSCYVSGYVQNPYWEVDLQVLANIEHIILYNRQDKYPERLRDFRVEIRDSHDDVVWYKDHPDAAGRLVEIHIAGGQQGQKVRVKMDRKEYLTLAQVEVYGLPIESGREIQL